jgi:hypothetical protein
MDDFLYLRVDKLKLISYEKIITFNITSHFI